MVGGIIWAASNLHFLQFAIGVGLFATLIGSGVYMRIKWAIDHRPLDDGEVGDVVHRELLTVNHFGGAR